MSMKKNVASQKWFVYAIDVTTSLPKTGDLANITAKLSKDGATGAALGDASPVELESGWYVFDLTQAETNYDSLALIPISGTANIEVMGMPPAVYPIEDVTGDAFARLGAPAGASVSADIVALQADTDNIQTRIPTVLVSGRMDSSVGAIAASAITSASIATGAITAGSLATNTITSTNMATDCITAAQIAVDAIGASELATDAVNEIRDAILSDSTPFLGASIAAILVDTGTTLDTKLNDIQGATFATGTDSLEAIRNQGDAAWTTGAGGSIANGTSDSGSTTTMVDAIRTEADTDYWKGDWIEFTSGNIDGQVRLITGFTPGTDTITFAPATTQAVTTQTYNIIAAANIDLVNTATTLTGHTVQTGDNFARLGAPAGASVSADVAAVKVDTAATLVDTAVIGVAGAGLTDITINAASVDAVWDELQSAHVAVGSFGEVATEVASILVDTAEIGTAGVGLTNIGTIATVTTLTGHTAQTGDTFALANGATGFVAIDTVVDGIQTDLSNVTDGLGAIKADTAATLVDTADMQPKIGAPAADLAADIAAVKVDTAATLVDTGTTLDTKLNDIQGATFVTGTDSLEAIRDRGDAAWITGGAGGAIVSGTSDSGSTTTMVDAIRTEADTDYWKGDWIKFTSGNIDGQVRLITGFTPGTDTVTFAPATTQAVTTQTYDIIAAADVGNVRGDVTGNVDGSVGSLTGHTVQTGDTFALANGATGFVAIDTVVDGIQTDLSNGVDGLGAIKADTAATLLDTAEIGTAGVGLTNISLPATGLDLILKTSTHSLGRCCVG